MNAVHRKHERHRILIPRLCDSPSKWRGIEEDDTRKRPLVEKETSVMAKDGACKQKETSVRAEDRAMAGTWTVVSKSHSILRLIAVTFCSGYSRFIPRRLPRCMQKILALSIDTSDRLILSFGSANFLGRGFPADERMMGLKSCTCHERLSQSAQSRSSQCPSAWAKPGEGVYIWRIKAVRYEPNTAIQSVTHYLQIRLT